MNIDIILYELLQGNSIIINNATIDYLNQIANILLSKDQFNEIQIDYANKLLRISNILYNNTDKNMLPLEDGVYDLLLEKYKEYDKNFQVGADIVHFNSVLYPENDLFNQIKNSNIENITQDTIQPFQKISDEYINFFNNMHYRDELLNRGPISYIDDRDVKILNNVDITGKKYRDIFHNNPELVGTLDKCKYVYNKQAIDKGVFDDPKVKILERDFFEPHFRMGLINQNSVINMVAELKYDGASIVGIIENSEIVFAYSRGDTGQGQSTDYTPIFRGYKFPRLPINHPRMEVKFEAIMTYENLYRYNNARGVEYKNCRTAINGLLGANDAPMFRDFITLVPLKVVIEDIPSMDRLTEIEYMNRYLYTGEYLKYIYISGQFPVVLYQIHMFVQEAEKCRPYMSCMYDGVVVSYIDNYMIESLGRENFINKYSMAIKFNSLKKNTKLLNVDYTIGQDGTITPIAHYNPIEFLGTIHQKATISSLGRFLKLDLHEGDIIEVEYINDVIPYVVRVVESNPNAQRILFPQNCPCCGYKLEISTSGDSAKCPNIKCPERVIKRSANMMSKLGIKDFGEEMMRSINISSLSKLLHITKNEISHIGDINSSKFVECMRNLTKKPINDYDIIGSLGFSNISKETWRKILNQFTINELLDLYVKDKEKLYTVLKDIKGIGPFIVNTIINEFEYFYIDLVEISLMKNIKKSKGCKEIKVRFSGVRDSELIEYLNQNGYNANEGSVTKDTDFLIIPDDSYTSTKVNKAKKYSVPIVTLIQFKKDIGYSK